MSSKWKHPKLGEFTFDFGRWTTKVSMSEFKTFSHAKFGKRSSGKLELSNLRPIFGPGANSNPPSKDAVVFAIKVLSNQKPLAAAIATALWEEFHGRGGTTGIWWDGKIDEIREIAKDAGLGALRTPDDLRRLLEPSGVEIAPFVFDDPTLFAQVTFGAVFEEEHGVAVLTDGEKVLGTGYMSDGAVPYKDRKAKRARRK